MLVDQMVVRGAEGTDKEVESVVNYLAKNFGPTTGAPSAAKSHDRNHAVNVNQATSAELSSSLGLSPEEAASIVAYRQQNGKFKEWRDLTKIPGIQASKIENKKDHLLF
jgi:competence ComEA-like helix-hairpin-helix protein